jgi:hypothetical protein
LSQVTPQLLLEEEEEFVKVLPLQTGVAVVVKVVEIIFQQIQLDLVEKEFQDKDLTEDMGQDGKDAKMLEVAEVVLVGLVVTHTEIYP